MKRIVLCADDYGQNRGISSAILTLAVKGRLSAISCMSAATAWPESAQQLRESSADVDMGLHFTLIGESYLDHRAQGEATSTATLGSLIGSAYLRQLDKSKVVTAFERQLDIFREHLGRDPDFIDGHQHIHQLPVVRNALIEVYQKRFTKQRPYIRSLARISANSRAGIKPQIIKALGARPLQRALSQKGIPHNRDFGGIYDFSPQCNYGTLMRDWLQQTEDGTLFMCHPGMSDGKDGSDPIAAARINEYCYLDSDEFLDDCRSANITLVRGSECGWK